MVNDDFLCRADILSSYASKLKMGGSINDIVSDPSIRSISSIKHLLYAFNLIRPEQYLSDNTALESYQWDYIHSLAKMVYDKSEAFSNFKKLWWPIDNMAVTTCVGVVEESYSEHDARVVLGLEFEVLQDDGNLHDTVYISLSGTLKEDKPNEYNWFKLCHTIKTDEIILDYIDQRYNN